MVLSFVFGQDEKRFQFKNWKSQQGKEYEDNSHEKLRYFKIYYMK